MKTYTLLCTLLLLHFFTPANAQTHAWQWAEKAGGQNVSYSAGICTDPHGNVYITGTYGGASITLGDTTIYDADSGLATAIILAKYNPEGHLLWAKSFNSITTGHATGNPVTQPNALSADKFGNVYMCGSYDGTMIIFGNDTLADPNSDQYISFLVKFDSSGAPLWARQPDGSYGSNARAICNDSTGNVYITGGFGYPSIFFGSTLLASTYGGSLFTVKYDTNGNVVWAKTAYSPNQSGSVGTGIAVDAQNNVYQTGYFASDSITFGNIKVYNPSASGSDVYTVKYDSSGNALWVETADGRNDLSIQGNAIAVDEGGNAYVTGTAQQNSRIIFGHDTLRDNYQGMTDVFIVKYNTNGNELWAKNIGGSNSAGFTGNDVMADKQGSLYLLAADPITQSSILVFDSVTVTVGNSTVTPAFYVVKYDSAGKFMWVSTAGQNPDGPVSCTAYAFAQDNNGAIYVTGNYQSTSTLFDSLVLTTPPSVVDIFLAKLDTTTRIETAISNIASTAEVISLFPNPSTGIYNIANAGNNTHLTITDAIGRQVLSTDLKTQPLAQANLSQQQNGMYFFRFTSAAGIQTIKAILNRGK